MGMITKYSDPLHTMYEHLDATSCDCDRSSDENEWCDICGTADFIYKQAVSVSKFELEVDAMIKQLAEKDAYLKEAMEMLDNVIYWESCPEDYKERIHKLTEAKP
jgi:hypothetical protein